MSGTLYLLRHEERDSHDISFDSPLTDDGRNRARTEVNNKLAALHIDTIYCSPYLRTLQTIGPYCVQHNREVNIEWSIAEAMPATARRYHRFDTIVNDSYQSFTPYCSDEITGHCQPHFQQLVKRVEPFLNTLDSSKNILLVTHLPIINVILYLKGHCGVQLYTAREPGVVITV